MLQRTPTGLYDRVGKGHLDLRENAVQACTNQDRIYGAIYIFDAGICVDQRPSRVNQVLAGRKQQLAGVRRVEPLRHRPSEDLPRKVVHHGLKVDLRAVHKLDDRRVHMPNFIWSRSTDTNGGLGRMDALSWSSPTALPDKLCPCCRRGEDLAYALGITSKGTKRHVPVLRRQHHVLDNSHLAAGELAGACSRTRDSVGELAGFLCPAPNVIAPRFEADDVQGGGQGKEGLGAGDGTKDPCLGLALWETISIQGEAGRTKQSEQEANNSGKDAGALLPTCTRIERAWKVLAGLLGGYDGTDASSPPSGNGGAGDLDVPWDRHGAAAHNLFAKAMVVGAPSWCC